MRLLLDTHILLWALLAPNRLSASVRKALRDPGNDAAVSVASIWEIAIKHALGRLHVPMESLEALIAESGFDLLPILLPHAVEAGALPRHHADPFDRMLVAQARQEHLAIVTADAALRRYDVSIFGT